MKILTALFLFSVSTLSHAELSNKLSVVRVYNNRSNQIAAGVSQNSSCSVFKGTYSGNSISLRPSAEGGSGRYSHTLVWQISESYQTFDAQRKQFEVNIRNGNSYTFSIPELKDDVPYVQQSVFLITNDIKTKKTVTTQLMFNVSRPIIIAYTNDPLKLEQNCFQVLPAIESVAGVLTNGSTNPSQILIRQGIQNLWTRTSGSQWGFYLSPLAWTGLGNVFSLYRNYFKQFSRQTIETVEVSSGYTIAPGDFIQLYEQRTRYVTAFDAFQVDPCGESEEVPGAYFLQWWGTAYHAVPINPYSDETVPREAIGVAPINHCPDTLTPEFARDNNDFIFTRTNKK